MKKLIIVLLLTVFLTGCNALQTDAMTNIRVYTGVYPTYYMAKYLYGDYADIRSIYPLNTTYASYKLTAKEINDYANQGDLMIFSGYLPEKNYTSEMLKKNKNLKLIDATYKLNYNNDVHELWLNPSSAVMIAKNIKNGLNEYITNPYLEKEVNKKFVNFNTKLTELDAEYQLMADNNQDKTLIFMDDTFGFYRKYGFNVITLENLTNVSNKDLNRAKSLIKSKGVKYIFVTRGMAESNLLKDLKKTYGANILLIDPIVTLTEKEQADKQTYFTKMQNNMDLLKKELYR